MWKISADIIHPKVLTSDLWISTCPPRSMLHSFSFSLYLKNFCAAPVCDARNKTTSKWPWNKDAVNVPGTTVCGIRNTGLPMDQHVNECVDEWNRYLIQIDNDYFRNFQQIFPESPRLWLPFISHPVCVHPGIKPFVEFKWGCPAAHCKIVLYSHQSRMWPLYLSRWDSYRQLLSVLWIVSFSSVGEIKENLLAGSMKIVPGPGVMA